LEKQSKTLTRTVVLDYLIMIEGNRDNLTLIVPRL